MRVTALALLAGAATFTCGSGARADTFTASQIIANFNAISAGNLSASETEGSIVAGGNITAGQVDIRNNPPSSSLFAGYGDANGYGNVSLNNANQQRIYAGGSLSGNLSGATVAQSNYAFPNPITSFTTTLGVLSSNLSMLPGSTVTTLQQNGAVIQPTSYSTIDGLKVGVVNLTSSVLQSTNSFSTALNGAQLLVVNVNAASTGGVVNVTANFNDSNQIKTDVIFNFYNAGTVDLPGWESTILAPDGTVQASSAIEGFVFANTINTNGELHFYPLAPGDASFINGESGFGGGTSVPEPSSLALLAVGLALLAARRKTAGTRSA